MRCPKCGSDRIWIEDEMVDSWLRCRCGLMRMVEQRKGGYVIKMSVGLQAVALPKKGTRQHTIFVSLASLGESNTEDISDLCGYNMDVVNNHLRVLEVARLVEIVEQGQGKPGGTTWELSRTAKQLLGD